MKRKKSELLEMVVRDVEVEAIQEGYQPVRLIASRGNVECRYYKVNNAQKGAIWVGGVGGDWDTPAKGLYPRLCQELMGEEIASLRVRYRYPTILEEAILDILAGINYLQGEGIKAVALTGHSFGGAAVICAGANSQTVRTVVALATQSYGAAIASQLAPHCSLLLLHGTGDEVLPVYCSEYVYQLAGEPKRLILYPGATHGLDEVAEEIHQAVRNWVIEKLSEVAQRSRPPLNITKPLLAKWRRGFVLNITLAPSYFPRQ